MEARKKRSPLVALVLSFLTPGLGQFYNGQIKRAALLYLGEISLIPILTLSGLFRTFWGLLFSLVVGIGFLLFVIIDAPYNATRLKELRLRSYNRWYIYLIIVLVNLFVINPAITSILPFKPYKIPAGSMEPTLLVGDHFVADRTIYRAKEPVRNDIVVFPYPEDKSKDFIKRVIGTPGDEIQMQDKQIFINDQIYDDKYGYYDEKAGNPNRYFGPVVVPKDHYFVLGDNRDHSLDSRFFGFVPFSELKGQALYIYWANDKGRIGKYLN
jgi:signal peptidase I